MRGQPMTTTLNEADAKYVEGLAKATNQSVSSILSEIVHNHIVAEERRWTSTPAAPPRKRK